MNIAYDILVERPELIPFINTQPDLDIFFSELLDFIMVRLKPLEDEIDKEENAAPDGHLYTLIITQPPPQQPDMFLWFEGYSKELVNRMKGCFSNDDFTFIMRKIQNIVEGLNN